MILLYILYAYFAHCLPVASFLVVRKCKYKFLSI